MRNGGPIAVAPGPSASCCKAPIQESWSGRHDPHAARSSIRRESVIIAVQGTLLGPPIRLFFGWALVRASEDQGLTVFRVPDGSLGIIVVLAMAAGMVAAIGPSRRAAKLNVLKAVGSD